MAQYSVYITAKLEVIRIVFEEGEDYNLEGEHDIAYLTTYEDNDPYNEDNIEDLRKQSLILQGYDDND